MPTPLDTFLKSARLLKKKPLEFWPPEESFALVDGILGAIQKLKGVLEKKGLSDSRAYTIIGNLDTAAGGKTFDEFKYIQTLSSLVEVYLYALSPDVKTVALIHDLERETEEAKKRIFEFHLLVESLEKKAAKISAVEQEKADLKTIQEVGVFYILEYTLQVLALWPHLNEKRKREILHEGLSVKEGNLPAYLPLEDTFRKELCLKLYDPKLRHTLLSSFYKFEEVFYTEDISGIGPALKAFNLSLLRAFDQKGIKTFKTLIYKPFGNNVPMKEMISSVAALALK